jgi:hypothetical protein
MDLPVVLDERTCVDRTIELFVAINVRVWDEDRAKKLVTGETHCRDTNIPERVLGQIVRAFENVKRRVPCSAGVFAKMLTTIKESVPLKLKPTSLIEVSWSMFQLKTETPVVVASNEIVSPPILVGANTPAWSSWVLAASCTLSREVKKLSQWRLPFRVGVVPLKMRLLVLVP